MFLSGSTPSSESFAQVTGKVRLADIPSKILNFRTMNDWFARERTVKNNAAMSELRDETDIRENLAAVRIRSRMSKPGSFLRSQT